MLSPESVTQLLIGLKAGDQEAVTRLVPLIYDELHRLANHYMRQERPDHTLQTTALVHEVYLRLVDPGARGWRNRAHFFGVAVHLMRSILVDHARGRRALKRGGDAQKLETVATEAGAAQ